MIKFKSFKEFLDARPDEWQGEPALIDDGWQMTMDMTVTAETAIEAYAAFEKEFRSPETERLLSGIREDINDGILSDMTKGWFPTETRDMWELYGGYKFSVTDWEDGRWCIFVTATGCLIGRTRAESRMTA